MPFNAFVHFVFISMRLINSAVQAEPQGLVQATLSPFSSDELWFDFVPSQTGRQIDTHAERQKGPNTDPNAYNTHEYLLFLFFFLLLLFFLFCFVLSMQCAAGRIHRQLLDIVSSLSERDVNEAGEGCCRCADEQRACECVSV